MRSQPKIITVCKSCGKPFKTWQYKLDEGKGMYCSIACAHYTPPECKFFKNVEITDTGCWAWKGHITKSGYAAFSQGSRGSSKKVLAHRFSYELHKGKIPAGLLVCHKCDNPVCTNPEHLFVGTCKENMEDMVNKGRSLKGDRNPSVTKYECIPKRDESHMAKLTTEQVIVIRKRLESCYKLAKKYNVHPSTIKDIWSNRTWKSL